MTAKYLKLFPKPLLADLVSGRWLPVIGAGMSLNAKLPSSKAMPLWPKLGEILASDLDGFSANGTLDSISAFQHEFGRSKLIERLTEILHIKDAQPGPAHEAFCRMPFDIVCTTNFDFLLERQYERTPQYVHTVVDEEQLSVNVTPTGTLVLKLHGDLRHPSRLVVTEEDYDGFLTRYPLIATYLSNLLITRTAVFVGYSLDDPDFRQIWNVVSSRLGRTRRMAYAIMVDAGASEIARFERRGVKVVKLPGSKSRYGEILADAFAELHAHWRDNVISASKVTEEAPLRELLLPRDAATRLCFFSIPVDRLALYRGEVFPHVEATGFVPVTADDVIAPGDNINAKIEALIDRSAVMVVEPSTQWTAAELRMALARKSRDERMALKTIVVGNVADGLPKAMLHDDIIYIEVAPLTDLPGFTSRLCNVLEGFAIDLGLSQANEPQRLLAHGETRAAVISAMTLLESQLRRWTPQITALSAARFKAARYRSESLRNLTDLATAVDYLSVDERDRILRWIALRNEVVHMNKSVTTQQAREVVTGVAEIVAKFAKAS